MSAVVEPGSPESAMLLRWSVLAEAGDSPAAWLVAGLGPCGAWDWAAQAVDDPVSATAVLAPTVPARTIAAAIAAAPRWAVRWDESDPATLRERTAACGAQVMVRGQPGWPRAFDSLGAAAPFALWWRGPADLERAFGGGIAVVGARSATAYGEHVAAGIAADVARGGATGATAANGARAVISGGAYGVDAAAHRAALAAGGTTVAVLAGGIDQVYPAGNADLLGRVAETGALVAEAPPGRAPYRARFLLRNRLIATAAATVVVEAAVRSGALSTARHAASIGRPVGAVPGPVTSAVSGGCHELLREGAAVLVRDASDARELAAPIGDTLATTRGAGELVAGGDAPRQEFASPADRAAYDACGGRGGDLDEISRRAGLTAAQALASLGRLELAGAVVKDRGVWRRPMDKRPRASPS
ncbi:DNA-processing protein DprA [Demequina litorisediminis]|uniref:DNA processing protein DprA n=1 Tax=Demequina litorisediminis TaxID=1849022 RepID=A0ABQ6IK26_9MICO|nr:DNA-processing protein DprA [Demequina litorisediminis]GMA37034.1 DNA processing protein DprA [Demequina litorisediminis]